MKSLVAALLLTLVSTGTAHGGHEHDHSEPEKGESMQHYAQRHMASEHHIDTFDVRSFFQLHDLNRDGFWDREEIEAVYGVHHIYAQQKSKDDIEHKDKADYIVNSVLAILDADKDGKVSMAELEAAGLAALPSYESMGAEGHHYDVESEFFLHHEEQFHSTPETQTDEAYSHPEDIEHFAHHERIEREEAEREAKFQGISVEDLIKDQHEHASPPTQTDEHQHPLADPTDPSTPNPKYTRIPPPEKQDPAAKYLRAAEGQAEWGSGSQGYKAPKSPGERMRKNLPYKYKFKRNWGDF